MFVCSIDKEFAQRIGSLFPEEKISVITGAVFGETREIIHGRTLVILDLETCGGPAVRDAAAGLTCPCLALTNVPSYEEAVVLMQKGIRGYGNKYMRPENLRQAVKTVGTGQLWLIPSILNRFIRNMAPEQPSGEDESLWLKISKRERQVARYIAQGLSNQEIADTIFVSVRTVKAHLTSIYNKTGCRDRMELALKVNKSQG